MLKPPVPPVIWLAEAAVTVDWAEPGTLPLPPPVPPPLLLPAACIAIEPVLLELEPGGNAAAFTLETEWLLCTLSWWTSVPCCCFLLESVTESVFTSWFWTALTKRMLSSCLSFKYSLRMASSF